MVCEINKDKNFVLYLKKDSLFFYCFAYKVLGDVVCKVCLLF